MVIWGHFLGWKPLHCVRFPVNFGLFGDKSVLVWTLVCDLFVDKPSYNLMMNRDHSGNGLGQWEEAPPLIGWAHTQNDTWWISPWEPDWSPSLQGLLITVAWILNEFGMKMVDDLLWAGWVMAQLQWGLLGAISHTLRQLKIGIFRKYILPLLLSENNFMSVLTEEPSWVVKLWCDSSWIITIKAAVKIYFYWDVDDVLENNVWDGRLESTSAGASDFFPLCKKILKGHHMIALFLTITVLIGVDKFRLNRMIISLWNIQTFGITNYVCLWIAGLEYYNLVRLDRFHKIISVNLLQRVQYFLYFI